MPIIEIKAFESRFGDHAKDQELIERVTDAFVEVHGEEVRAETWVLLHGVPARQWGFGGSVRS